MNHRPFEEWLRAERQSDGERRQSLAAHVESCEICQSLIANLKNVEVLFQASGEVAPRAGFVGRWRARLSQQKIEDERRQAMAMLGVNSAIAAVLFVLLAAQTLPILASPVDFLAGAIQGIAETVLFLNVSARLLESLTRILPGLLPPSWWLVMVSALAGMLVLWLATLRQYAYKQGVQK